MDQIRIKCVFLGDEGIGKTSLIVRYTKGIFLQYSESTIGCSFNAKPMKIDDLDVRLDIWDTAGQERYRSMMPMYYRNADIVFLCVDLSKHTVIKTFNSWLKELNNNNDNKDNRVLCLVGTKFDLKNDVVMNDIDYILNRHPEIKFIETSSKNNFNIDALFNDSAKEFIEVIHKKYNRYNKDQLALKEVNRQSGGWMDGFCSIL